VAKKAVKTEAVGETIVAGGKVVMWCQMRWENIISVVY
jgi:hypothetical protein